MADQRDQLRTWAAARDPQLALLAVDRVNSLVAFNGWRPDVLRSLPSVLALPWRTYDVEIEVLNGGYFQYFWNGGGEIAEDTANDFAVLGASRYEAIHRAAFAAYTLVAPEFERHRQAGNDSYQTCLELETFETQDDEFMDEYEVTPVLDVAVEWLATRVDDLADALESRSPPN